MRRLLVILLVLPAVLGVAGVAAIAWTGSSLALRPPWYEQRTPEEGLRPIHPNDDFFIWDGGYRDPGTDLGLAYENIEVPAIDGASLRGWLVPGRPGATAGIVAVHGGGGDRREFLRQVPVFHEVGLPVVLFDCREQGVSDGEGRGISLGLRESEDVSAMVAWAKRELGWHRVAVIGTSQGGASVLMAAAADPTIDVVIAENAFTSVRDLIASAVLPDGTQLPSWAAGLIATTALVRMAGPAALSRPSPLEAVPAISPRPLLLMHGTEDAVIPLAQAHRLHEAAGEPVDLWVLEGARHSALFNHAPGRWTERVRGFLDAHLLAENAP